MDAMVRSADVEPVFEYFVILLFGYIASCAQVYPKKEFLAMTAYEFWNNKQIIKYIYSALLISRGGLYLWFIDPRTFDNISKPFIQLHQFLRPQLYLNKLVYLIGYF